MKRLFLCLLLVSSAPAQNAILEELRKTYEATLGAIDEPLTQWDVRYSTELKKLEAKAQDDGDLDLVLAIRNEVLGIGGVRPKIDAKYASLRRMRGIYDKKVEELQKTRVAKLEANLKTYGRNLAALQKKLTVERKIDEAIAVKTELDAVRGQLQDVSKALAASRIPRGGGSTTGSTGNREPGRLVAWGKHHFGEVSVPEGHAETPVVSVSADAFGWLALAADGKVIAQKQTSDLEDVKVTESGQHGYWALKNDGSLVSVVKDGPHSLIPVGLANVEQVSSGIYHTAALLRNGTVVPFGPRWEGGFKGPAEMLTGAAKVATGRNLYVLKKSGELWGVDMDGQPLPNKPEIDNIIDMRASQAFGCAFLTRDGDIKFWHHNGSHGWGKLVVPEEAKNARQLRQCRGILAVQRADRTWFCFSGEQHEQEKVAEYNRQLQALGPLKDFDIGVGFFVGVK